MVDDLIQRARSRDEAALRQLYERHRQPVFRLAYGILRDHDEAEDVMQDVMVQALSHLERYDPQRGAFSTWLHTITVNRCRDRLRRRRLQDRLFGWLQRGDVEEPATPAPDIEHVDTDRRIARALGDLTDLQREALLLREVEELSFAELGEVLGVPLRTAQARVNSAAAALRRAWATTEPRGGSAARAANEGKGGDAP